MKIWLPHLKDLLGVSRKTPRIDTATNQPPVHGATKQLFPQILQPCRYKCSEAVVMGCRNFTAHSTVDCAFCRVPILSKMRCCCTTAVGGESGRNQKGSLDKSNLKNRVNEDTVRPRSHRALLINIPPLQRKGCAKRLLTENTKQGLKTAENDGKCTVRETFITYAAPARMGARKRSIIFKKIGCAIISRSYGTIILQNTRSLVWYNIWYTQGTQRGLEPGHQAVAVNANAVTLNLTFA